MDLLNVVGKEPEGQPVRKRKPDQAREEKIRYFRNSLTEDPEMTVGIFLEAMANKDILPGIGKHVISNVNVYQKGSPSKFTHQPRL